MVTLTEAAEQIRTRKLSPVELTLQCLVQIDRHNPTLNAFVTVTADSALEQAREAEREVSAAKWRGPLHGIPIALKDLIDTAGVPTTAASNQLRDRVPNQDADLVRQLKLAGVVLVGKTNLHEFAFGGSGVVSAFGPVRNPWNTERITGGSSSGSAAAVASGMCMAAIGTDTGGSIRCPAALCGIVGYRPSKGMLDMKGIIPLSTSFDTAGPMTQTVRDAATLCHALVSDGSGSNARQPLQALEPSRLDERAKSLVVALPRTGYFDDVAADVHPMLEEALGVIRTLVADVRDVDLPIPDRGKVFNAEVYEYHEAMVTKTPELYQPRTIDRLQACAGVSASDYIRKSRTLEMVREQARLACRGIDLVLTPTVHIAAPGLSQLQSMESTALRQFETQWLLRNTIPFSALCWPSISVPCGFTVEGLPVGLQISAPPGGDEVVLRLAHAYQAATDWHTRRPVAG